MSEAFCAHAEAAALILANVDLNGTMGIAYIGGVLSCMVYGVTCIQTFHYFRSQQSRVDAWYLRNIVALLLFLDTGHQAIIIQALYYYVITNYNNPFAFLRASWSIPTEVIINAVIAFVVESFFVLRIWKLGRNVYVTATAMLFTVAHFTMNLYYPIEQFYNPEFPAGVEKLKATGSAGLAVAVVADTFISAAMVWYLHKGKSGIRRSDDMIGRIIALTITTGGLTTTFVILNLIAYQLRPQLLYNLAINFLLGKLYINALLTSLNSRSFVRSGMSESDAVSVSLSTFAFRSAHLNTTELSGSDSHRTLADGSLSKVSSEV
ncbi:hypothetical protein GSI_05459 [Ganoderma sinense ZZ0214-1]|uniref:DUF6534 domain-containing protein n=1 Tax=Ganoderma sinense ZZ0214-1 TaxID=1077348 RepID=A0A2G8SEL4_9APHY|nr:hypothetical protein GSI_05459 [Ganoderma sinense ZZ0214-1]